MKSPRMIFWLLVWCIVILVVCFGILETPLIAQVFSR